MIEKIKKVLRLATGASERELGLRERIDRHNERFYGLTRGGHYGAALLTLKGAQKEGLERGDLHRVADSPMEAACSAREGEEMIKALLSMGQPIRGVLVVSQEGCIEPLEICFRRGRWGSAGLLLSEIRGRARQGQCEDVGGEALRWAMECCARLERQGAAPSEKEIRRMLSRFESLSLPDSAPGAAGARAKQAMLLWRAVPCPSALRALISLGADVNERSEARPREPGSEGETALFKAALEASLECVEILLAAGADPLLQNAEGLTAAESLAAAMAAQGEGRKDAELEQARVALERLEQAEREARREAAGPRRILARGPRAG